MDEWVLLDEVNVLATWPPEKKALLASDKWQERKESLEVLLACMERNPRLCSSTSYGELIDSLRMIVSKDSNINVVLVALNVICALSRGLRHNFSNFVGKVWPHVLEKSKDKKKNVQIAVGETLDAIAASAVDPEKQLTTDLLAQLQKPSPPMKQCICSFMYRYFKTLKTPPMPFFKTVLPIVVKLASDSDPQVREDALKALGSSKRLLGDAISVFLQPLNGDAAKLTKIEESFQLAKEQWAAENVSNSGTVLATASMDGSDETSTTSNDIREPVVDIDPWTIKEPVDIYNQMDNDFGTKIQEKDWKLRKEAVDGLAKLLEGEPRVLISLALNDVVYTLIKVLDKDININVSSTAAKCLAGLARGAREEFAKFVPAIVPIACDKLKEKKPVLRQELVALCDVCANTVCLSSFAEQLAAGMVSKNPQSRGQSNAFAARLIARHDSRTLPVDAVKTITDSITKSCADADGDVREAALTVVAAVQKSVGKPICCQLFREVMDDKLKSDKVSQMMEKLKEEYGTVASLEMRRLYDDVIKNGRPERVPVAAKEKPLPSGRTAPNPRSTVMAPRQPAREPAVLNRAKPSAPISQSSVSRTTARPTPVRVSASAVPPTMNRPATASENIGKTKPNVVMANRTNGCATPSRTPAVASARIAPVVANRANPSRTPAVAPARLAPANRATPSRTPAVAPARITPRLPLTVPARGAVVVHPVTTTRRTDLAPANTAARVARSEQPATSHQRARAEGSRIPIPPMSARLNIRPGATGIRPPSAPSSRINSRSASPV